MRNVEITDKERTLNYARAQLAEINAIIDSFPAGTKKGILFKWEARASVLKNEIRALTSSNTRRNQK